MTMQAVNPMAFKEWAVVCAALEQGRQSLILRKGGIHEGREGFRVQHGEFWLFPTRFHQDPEEITDDARSLLDHVRETRPPEGIIPISLYAVVQQSIYVEDESILRALRDLHIWSEATVSQRFHYRQPGLFLLPVRVYRRAEPYEITDRKQFAGCRSWVDLRQELSTEGLEPVLSDAEFGQRMERVRRLCREA